MTYKLPPGVGAYRRRPRQMGDGETNPDGSPTYDGAPYDPTDPDNPYNISLGIAQETYTPLPPATIPLATTSMGPAPGQISIAPTGPPPVTGYTPLPTLPAPTVAPVATSTNWLTSLVGSIFKPAVSTTPLPYGTSPLPASILPKPATSSTTTLLLLAAAAVGVFVLTSKKKSA